MKKFFLVIISSVLLPMYSCTNNDLKTEIMVQLSENEYLYYVYDGYFDESQGQTIETADPKLISELRAEMEPSKEEAIGVLAKRIESAADPVPALAGLFNKLSVTWVTGKEPNTWVITINRKVDSERIKMLLEATPHGGFFETYEIADIWDHFSNINIPILENDILTSLNIEPDTTEYGAKYPLFMILRLSIDNNGEFRKGSNIGVSKNEHREPLNTLFSMPSIRSHFPYNAMLVWSHKPTRRDETKEYYELHAIKGTRDGKPLLGREFMTEAIVDVKSYEPIVKIHLTAEGARIFSGLTRDNVDKNIAFVMNNEVYFSAAVSQEITNGEVSISADFEEREAEDFAILMGSGYMRPFGVKVLDIRQ